MTEQSEFNDQQEIIQAPPEVLAKNAAKAMAPKKKNRLPLYIAGGLITVLLILIGIVIALSRQAKPQPVANNVPTPAAEAPLTKTQLELKRLQPLVIEADPEGNPFPPPQVDMQVKF